MRHPFIPLTLFIGFLMLGLYNFSRELSPLSLVLNALGFLGFLFLLSAYLKKLGKQYHTKRSFIPPAICIGFLMLGLYNFSRELSPLSLILNALGFLGFLLLLSAYLKKLKSN